MKRILIAMCVLVGFTVSSASALSVQFEVTPENIKNQQLTFDVEVSKSVSEEHALYFVITVRKGKVDFIPFYSASLTIMKDNEELVVRCPLIGEEKDKSSVVYLFSVSRDYLSESTFIFTDFAHNAQGKPMPSADIYLFKLKAFGKEK